MVSPSSPPPPKQQRRPQPQVAGVFETPVLVDQMADAAALNEALRSLILKRQSENEGIGISNVGGWHSDTAMLDWGGEPARMLCRRVIELADTFTVDVKAGEQRRHGWAPEMWANVSGRGSSNRHHCHPGAYWSAVYYVDDGYGGSSDRDLGGELVLFDPRMPMVRMTAPDLRFKRPDGSTDHDEVFLRPAAGRLVMFPAWLNHSVLTYNGSGTRISVAINLTPVRSVSERRQPLEQDEPRGAAAYSSSSETSR